VRYYTVDVYTRLATASFQAVDLHTYKQLQLTLRLYKHTRITVLLLWALTIAIVFPVHAQQQSLSKKLHPLFMCKVIRLIIASKKLQIIVNV